MQNYPATVSQKRLVSLLGLNPKSGSYQTHKTVLRKSGYYEDGMARTLDWRESAKLTDSELLEQAKKQG
jgi:hypothetical protein